MKLLLKSIFGPNLYRIYSNDSSQTNKESESAVYLANSGEKFGNNIIRGINVMLNVGLYTSPLIIWYFYKRDYFCVAGCLSLGKVVTGITLLCTIGMIIRGFGRFCNPVYRSFLDSLISAQTSPSPSETKLLSKYDFELSAWPSDFSVKTTKSYVSKTFSSKLYGGEGATLWWLMGLPCHVAAYFCIHLFGRHLIYPGSIQFLQTLMDPVLAKGREKLIVGRNGIRSKVETWDGNCIDTVFVDRRDSGKQETGSTLVICCEGNAGFYEVGLMSTPLEAGYSVLGWNHPGFASSTGLPFPTQEQHAVDAVVQYAIHRLGFKVEDIMIYAWSIGGYTGALAAMNYPEIRGLVLDATFDDILPLALPRMPNWMGGLVKLSIRKYMNLNVVEPLQNFSGPVTIIRRTKDEVIATTFGDISTNRGNFLLIKVLNHRFPTLFKSVTATETLRLWASEDERMQDSLYKSLDIEEELMQTMLTTYAAEMGLKFPMAIGDDLDDSQKTQLLLFIAKKIFVNVKDSHNNPLDPRYFQVPWTLLDDPSFVQL